ncbi:zinc finger protein 185 isoform X2 [Mugil cephalus]|uniref:zinc finger protein 185 isoform X2 n=1 Tax=Mugil cephalus TaxID=48193 RepID=UPI001FB73511|nr:zinc finger protein 185 isoform X2 [Mugil cephalus]
MTSVLPGSFLLSEHEMSLPTGDVACESPHSCVPRCAVAVLFPFASLRSKKLTVRRDRWPENTENTENTEERSSMSKEGDRAAVFRTTKVRTKLKGDASWLQRSKEPETEAQEEKPWVAEVRASRLNGAPIETSPVSSPTEPTPPKTDTERAPASGYLIRGVFTKLDQPAPSATSNGHSKTTQFTKKPSETYKRIAPHTVRPSLEKQEGQLSFEEQERRTEAASNVLKRSAVRHRSYVLSAAKKYESKENEPETSVDSTLVSFVAKRVEITDDDDTDGTPAPASAAPPSPVVPATSVAPAPEPSPQKIVDAVVKTSAEAAVKEAPKVEEAAPEPVKEEPTPAPVTEKDPFEGMKPGCTKVDTPLPELVVGCVPAAATKPEQEDSGHAAAPLVELCPPSQSDETPAPSSAVAESPAPVSVVAARKVETKVEPEVKSEPEPEPEPAKAAVQPEPEPEPEPKAQPSPAVDTLAALSDTLIGFDTSSPSSKDDEPALAKEEGGSADSPTTGNSTEEEPAPAISNCVPITDDLLGFTDGPEEPAEPVPPSPGRWSQDLLSELESEPVPEKSSGPLDLLANDIIEFNTEARSLSTQQEEEEQTDETAKETQSSADPFDPYPIGTTSPNSSSDLLQPLSHISINSPPRTSTEDSILTPENNALVSLADDIIPINTDTSSTQRSWARTWEVSAPQQADAEESQDAEPEPEPEAEGQDEDQHTLIKFERKSTENDSPWDRWTSPTVYTVTTEEDEEEEEEAEEESPEDVQTVTTTTIREIYNEPEPEPAMDRYEPYSRTVKEEEQRVQTPEPKKGFVYVKEYVNATELSLHNPRDTIDGGLDYLSSSSATYSYSSPTAYSRAPLASTCTYCGEQVGNDAKITIEHLNINCHPACFKCGVCSKPMGDLLHSMFLHGGTVHCESCYATVN